MDINKKVAIVTGIRGMDGSILCDMLLEKDYKIFGMIRRSSSGLDLGNSNHLRNNKNLEVVEGDLTDPQCLIHLCKLAKADLFFSMGAQSHVGTSFEQPYYTAQVTGIGVLNCLEAIRLSGINTKFLTASTSEMYGGVSDKPANEETPFKPQSPYAAAKLFAHNIVNIYRTAYKVFACTTICYNHEAARRADTFVTRKITKAVSRIKYGLQNELFLGNLDARRDWFSAIDACRGMIDILTKTVNPDDYVMASGKTTSVRDFCKLAFEYIGLDYQDYVKIDPKFFRPAEVNVLIGDYSKINKVLGWKPILTLEDIVKEMMDNDLLLAELEYNTKS